MLLGRKQSSTTYPVPFLIVASSDHVTPRTGLTPGVQISLNGGAFVSPVGAISEIGSGWYCLSAAASDRHTLGSCLLHASAVSSDPSDLRFEITTYDPFAVFNADGKTLLQDGALTSGVCADAFLTSAKIAAGGLAATNIATGAFTAAKFAASAITSTVLADDCITALKLANAAITSDKFASGAINAAAIAADAIGASELAADAAAEIATAVAAAILATPANKLATDGSGYVGVAALADDLITAAKLAADVGPEIAAAVWAYLTASASTAGSFGVLLKNVVPVRITKNTAINRFPFIMIDSSDHVTPKSGLTVTAVRSLDGAAFAACANSPVEIGSGAYYVDLAAADTNANFIIFKFSSTGADDRLVLVVTQPAGS